MVSPFILTTCGLTGRSPRSNSMFSYLTLSRSPLLSLAARHKKQRSKRLLFLALRGKSRTCFHWQRLPLLMLHHPPPYRSESPAVSGPAVHSDQGLPIINIPCSNKKLVFYADVHREVLACLIGALKNKVLTKICASLNFIKFYLDICLVF